MGIFSLAATERVNGMRNEYEKIYCYESLYQAHKMARRSKQNKKEVILYEMRLTENLEKLRYHLKNHTYRIRGYRKFLIYDPKKREIQALHYGDRIVQHSLCDNVLGPYLENHLIYDNSACRKGKGTHFALDRLTHFLRQYYRNYGGSGYILKCDVRKYFNSIDHEVLKQKVECMDLSEDVRWLLHMIIESYEYEKGKGLPMGNQTSQWFALYYLDSLDRLVKEKLRIRYYSRYMDDMILIHPSREYLKECLSEMQKHLEEELRLEFNEKTQIHAIRQGVDYLGFHLYLTDTGKVVKTLRQSGKKRLKRKLRHYRHAFADGKIELDAISQSVASYKGHLKHAHTYRLQKNIWNNFTLKRKRHKEDLTYENETAGSTIGNQRTSDRFTSDGECDGQ